MMYDLVLFLLTLTLVYMCFHPEIHRFFQIKCPKCDGKLEACDLHTHIFSTSTVYECTECKKKWI